MAFTREELLDIADQAGRAGNDADAAEAMKMLDELDASTSKQNIADFESQGEVSKLGTTLGDMLSAGVHGVTFGADDRAAAGLHTLAGNVGSTLGISDDVNYDQALAQEQGTTRARQDRMNHLMPGSSSIYEAGGSLAAPGGILKAGAAKMGLGEGKLVSAIASTLENSGYGAASAYGHGQDPLKGAAVGAGGTAIAPLVRYGLPIATKWGLGTAGATAGGAVAGFPGAWAGGEAGRRVGGGAGRFAAQGMDSNTGREALAALSAAPGRLYGWATGR